MATLIFGRGRPEEDGEVVIKCDSCDNTATLAERPYENGWTKDNENIILCPGCIAEESRRYERESLMNAQLRGTFLEPIRMKFAPVSDDNCEKCHRPTPAREITTYRGRCEDCSGAAVQTFVNGSDVSRIPSGRDGRRI